MFCYCSIWGNRFHSKYVILFSFQNTPKLLICHRILISIEVSTTHVTSSMVFRAGNESWVEKKLEIVMNGHLGVVILIIEELKCFSHSKPPQRMHQIKACLIILTMNSKANARMPEQVCLKLRKYEKVRFSSWSFVPNMKIYRSHKFA